MEDVIDIEVTPLSAACGAEIKGVDLTRPLSDETVADDPKTLLGQASRAWCSGVQSLSEGDQLRFASYFGALGDRRKAPERLEARAEGEPTRKIRRFFLVSNIKGRWQACDRCVRRRRILVPHRFRPIRRRPLQVHLPLCPPRAAVDRRQRRCSPTCTRHTRAVPAALKAKLEGKKALHIHEYKPRPAGATAPAISAAYRTTFCTRCSPPTRTPATKTLFVDRLMTTRIEGRSCAESAAIMLDQLYEIGERRRTNSSSSTSGGLVIS